MIVFVLMECLFLMLLYAALAFVIVYCLGVMGVIIMSFAAIPMLFVLLLLISSSRILDQPKA